MLTHEQPKLYVLSPEVQDDLWKERLLWLNSFGVYGETVIDDKEGEFIVVSYENGTPGEEGYSFDDKKRYLPKHLEKQNIFAEVDYSKAPF